MPGIRTVLVHPTKHDGGDGLRGGGGWKGGKGIGTGLSHSI